MNQLSELTLCWDVKYGNTSNIYVLHKVNCNLYSATLQSFPPVSYYFSPSFSIYRDDGQWSFVFAVLSEIKQCIFLLGNYNDSLYWGIP